MAKRRFINIVRLGDIPGLTKKNTDYLQNKKGKNFLKKKTSKKMRRNNVSLNFSILNISNSFKYKKLIPISYYSNYFLYQTKLTETLKNLKKNNLLNIKEKNNYKWVFLYYIYKNILLSSNILEGNANYLLFNNFSRYLYQLKERQRIKKHYQLKDYQLEKIIKKFINNKEYNTIRMQHILNSKLDSVLFNNNKEIISMKFAKQLITHKKVKINNNTINKPNYLCKDKDKISFELPNKKEIDFIFSIKDTNANENKFLNFINYTALFEYYLKKI